MAGEEHPLIAVHGQLVADETPFLKLATAYTNALLRAGAIPVVVPAEAEPADLERLCARVDGIVLSGGDDFDTERLGLGPTHPAATPVPPEKQDLDMVLVRIAIERQIPVLGICYGMQLMALSEGGTLFQHLPEDRPGSQDHTGGRKHAIRVEGNTKLARALGVEQLDTISRHHQAVAGVGPDWSVSAVDDEGLIEGIERNEHPFALGVQWHPELSPPGGAEDRLFQALVAAAAARSGTVSVGF